MDAVRAKCDARGNVIVVGRVEGSQSKGLDSPASDIDLTVGFLEALPNMLSMRPRDVDLAALPFERFRKVDAHGEPVRGHNGFLFEGAQFEVTLLPLFTKGHLVYPERDDADPGVLNRWVEGRSSNELLPQLYFQNGKAFYDLFTAVEAYEHPAWAELRELVSTRFHISGKSLFGFFQGYMSSQLKAHENTMSFKNFLNVHNLTSSPVWPYMSDADKAHWHETVKTVQRAFEKFRAENPVIKGRRWIDFEKRERKALEENRVDPVVKQVLEGTYIGLCGVRVFEEGVFDCDFAHLLKWAGGVVRREHAELLERCYRHKRGVEPISGPVDRFLADVRQPRLQIFASIQEALQRAKQASDRLVDDVTPELQSENEGLLRGYLIRHTPQATS